MIVAPPTWLITGASSGLGKSPALEALKAGYKVTGTTRDIINAEIACPDFSVKGDIGLGLDPNQQWCWFHSPSGSSYLFRHEGYKGTTVEQMVNGTRHIMSVPDFVKGDPDKAARAIINATVASYGYLRMPLGTDCVVELESKIRDLQRDLEATRSIATTTDID
ncbi:hypothetical protein BDV36DRAFT_298098 [Aspergillus pseudocaelatus]|uniref:Uncharacterized protein n=1 Tax=Aspergillus pseudocaelatus TaxID=1825620 RepID=A0ABQ6WDY5_9EURO|nr:hypothetical protein BDV36DRAFT_298098 [Aspergillus pseudocaelatus]